MWKKSLHKHYKKRVLAILVTATMILPSNFGIDFGSKVKAASVDISSDLVAYYSFDNVLTNEQDPTKTAIVSNAEGIQATNSTATYVSGANGQGVHLNAQGLKFDDKITSQQYTVSFWFNAESFQTFQGLFHAAASKDPQRWLSILGQPHWTQEPGVAVWSITQGSSEDDVWGWQGLSANKWYYITLSADELGTSNLYVNGVNCGTFSGTADNTVNQLIKDATLYLGCNIWTDTPYTATWDEFTIYNRNLTAEEVKALYNRKGIPGTKEIVETGIITDVDLQTSYDTVSGGAGVTVHDPSIIEEDGTYYIFGSHLAWAKSTDLVHWEPFTNNISTDYATLFKTEIAWAELGDAHYNPSGNIWAPDIIWNEKLNKWCMYMSINGGSWNSAICMLTADHLNGNWTYVDTIIYSGFTEESGSHNYKLTDYEKVTGETSLDSRYAMDAYTQTLSYYDGSKDVSYKTSATTWNKRYGAHAIDPCVFYDTDGILWMSYGSWSGGIYMIELDKNTGLRDYERTYEYNYPSHNEQSSDPYMGIRIAGGNSGTGEASYIQYINGYYYLFVTYGGLVATGGYNMRLFRSRNATGPYTDVSGNLATGQQGVDSNVGLRLMGYHKWSWWSTAQTAQGHNSAYYDKETGKIFLFCHSRTDDGTEGHYVIVHQMFLNEAGWLCVSPFEYDGEETIESIKAADVAGTYEVIPQIATNYTSLESAKSYEITLTADGKVNCNNNSYAGVWEAGKNGIPYITLSLGGVTYKGVLAESTIEGLNKKTITFSVIGSSGDTETALWGVKLTDDLLVAKTAKNITIPSTLSKGQELQTTGSGDVAISWTADKSGFLTGNTISEDAAGLSSQLKLTIQKGKYSYTTQKTATVTEELEDGKILIGSSFVGEEKNLNDFADGSLVINNPFYGKNNGNLDITKGVSIKFDIKNNTSLKVLAPILTFASTAGQAPLLYFTEGSYLGYNANGNTFDANLLDYALVKDYIGTSATVELEFKPDGFTVYVNNTKAYDQTILKDSSKSGAVNPADMNYFSYILDCLADSMDKLYFGYGNWWSDAPSCTISNVKFYTYSDTIEPIYKQNYTSATASDWTSGLATTTNVATDNDHHGNYIQITQDSTTGNRGAFLNFPSAAQLLDNYEVNLDAYLTPGDHASGVTALAIFNQDANYSANSANNGVIAGYLLKLSYTGNYSGNKEYTINDNAKVTIDQEWIHIKAVVKSAANTADITITNGTNILYSGTVTGDTAKALKGLYVSTGRGGGSAKIDNITVTPTDNTCAHKWELTDTVSATCTVNGKYVYTCSKCNTVKEEAIPAVGHCYDSKVKTTEETCTTEGVYTYTCSACKTTKKETIPALGHSFANEYTEQQVATCTQAGIAAKECIRCDETIEPKETPALGHDFSTEFTVDKEATCTETGSKSKHCSRCDAKTEVTEIAIIDHTSDEGTITIEPGCETEGEKVYKCSVCDELLETETIKALGHDWSEWIKDKEATTTEEGEEHRTCSRCNKTETHTIPKIETWEGFTEVSGEFTYGSVVSASAIVIDDLRDDIRLSYKWYRSDSASEKGTEITGALEGTYTLTKEDIGKYISVEISSESYIGSLTGEGSGPVQKRAISINKVVVEDKPYDTTTKAAIEELAFQNVAEDEEISYTAEAFFASANAATEIEVTVIVTLTGDSEECYLLENKEVKTTASITKIDPEYQVPEKLIASYGQTLKELQDSLLKDTGFTFEDPLTTVVGDIGVHSFNVTYTPEDTMNYNIITGIKVQVEVQAVNDYEVPTGLTAVYGTTLGDIILPEKFTFEDDLTTPVGNVGVNVFTVTYTPEKGNGDPVKGIQVNITVTKADPSYNIPTGLTAVYGTTLGAIILPEGFTFEDPLSTTVGDIGTNIKLVTYTPMDSVNYNVITGIEVEIEVIEAVNDYEVPTGLTAVYGTTLGAIILPEGFTFEDDLTTSVGNVGVNVFTVTYTPEEGKGEPIEGININITVVKANPVYTLPSDLKAKEGQTLKDLVLPEGFSFVDDLETSVGTIGSHEFEVIYTPEDTQNYNIITDIKVVVIVEAKEPEDDNKPSGDNNNNNNNSNNNYSPSNNGSSSNNTGTNKPSDTTDTQKPSDDNNPPEEDLEQPTTEIRPDGTKVETLKETQSDGTIKETITETQPNGIVKETITETKPDGSVKETKEVTTGDNSATLKTTVETDASGKSSANAVILTGVSNSSSAVQISEELLKDAVENNINSVIVEVTDTTVNSASANNKNTIVTVHIPSVEGIEVEKVVLTKESIEAAKEKSKGLKVNIIAENATTASSDSYTVTIPAKQLAKIDSSIEEVNVTINAEPVNNVKDSSKKDAITKIVNNNNGKKKKTCVISIASNEKMNAGMKVTIPVTEKTNIAKGTTVYVYKYDTKTGKLIETANCKQKVTEDGNVVISAINGNDYVVSAKKLSGNKVETIKDNISVSVSKKSAKIGKTINVIVSLPDTVSTKTKFGAEKATITYKSSNSKIASVSKNGTVTTKKKGTARITTTIKLASGQKVTKEQKITVK